MDNEQVKEEAHQSENNTENIQNNAEEVSAENLSEQGNHATSDDVEEKLFIAEEKIKDLEDSKLRLFAEFENFRRRTIKEKAELISQANKDLILDILPIFDDFERALQLNNNEETSTHPMFEGVQLIYQKFSNLLNKSGVKPIIAQGELFDTELHEAITTIPASTEELKGKVVDEIKKGYTLHDKVIRYAQVVVGE